ncbi:LysR family transcriptional regulator [Stutzerimonas stutzeri]|uniref:LysR family transcriptional regulator n=1 Tax=Stutzerimonas stutzeri TaxID=316 RepID=A0A2N8T809_STUST|nr:LysR family transcriptional regulator [Stutzerimonas stutzeri]MCQ4324577.1 LysR family transcriptional regulator [Stutzerimonas stutzeri]PNG10893.1 LysR family transcriptional regulator [Stutzerimonas stutzeri]
MQPDALSAQLSLFIDVLDAGSFSAAARRHALTPSAVARRIDALEKSLGCLLFSRSTHAVRPTPAALAFAERARRIVQELHLARAEAASLDSTPEGRIRIDAPAPFGRRHLAPALAEFLQAYPSVDIQLRLIDSFVDLHGEHLGEVDLVLRIGPLADTRLVATPLAPMVRIVCASPAYLERRGMPTRPEELLEHDGLDWDALAPPHAWRFARDGRTQAFRPRRLRMVANNAEALLAGALAGLGIAHLPTWLISDYLLRGELLSLFCEGGLPQPEASGIYALRLTREADSRSRLLLEFLKSRFGPVPPWDQALQSGFKRD